MIWLPIVVLIIIVSFGIYHLVEQNLPRHCESCNEKTRKKIVVESKRVVERGKTQYAFGVFPIFDDGLIRDYYFEECRNKECKHRKFLFYNLR